MPSKYGKGLGIGKPLTAIKGTESYNIVLGQDYRVYCTCPAWKFSKPPVKECKHLRELFDIEGDSVMLELQKPRVVSSRDKASIRKVTL